MKTVLMISFLIKISKKDLVEIKNPFFKKPL